MAEKDEGDGYLRKRSVGSAVRQCWCHSVKQNQASDEQDRPQGARLVQDCILTQPGPVWTHPDRPGRQSAAMSWNWGALHLCNESSQNQAAQSHWLGWVCFCWCAWLEIAYQQRFRASCALNTQQCNPISTAESQICPREFWGSEISKIHPGIMQCLISISDSSICNSRNLPLGKSGQYEDFTETNGDQRKPCWKLELSTWGSSQSEMEQLSP